MPASRLIRTNAVRGPNGTVTLGALVDEFAAKHGALSSAAAPVVLLSASPVELIGAAAWLADTQTDGLILPRERLSPELQCGLLEKGFSLVDLDAGQVTSPAVKAVPQHGRVCLLTSGTTGEPKVIEHTWNSLFTMARVKSSREVNWLLTYQAGTYAWFQMVTMGLFLVGQSVTVCAERTPVALMEAGLRSGVTAISATPTFWRMVLLQFSAEDLCRLPLRQITLGGEAVDQAILDRLRSLYSAAAVTHIYASTEAGAAIVVRDGLEGFPAAWLNAAVRADVPADTPQLQIRDGILWIRSPYATQSGWLNTGDLCEVRGDRVIILGREQSTFINVGGAKVPAHEVERVLRSHPAVLWCRVRRKKAPFIGELVAADVVFKSPIEKVSEAELTLHCQERLAEHMVPRFWNLLETIPVTDNLKTKLN